MSFRLIAIALLLAVCAQATPLTSRLFASARPPALGELLTGRAVAITPANGRVYVLDRGLRRVVAFSRAGVPVGAWTWEALRLDAPEVPTSPLLPQPALAGVGATAWVLNLDRTTRTLDVIPVDTAGTRRTVTLPDDAQDSAVTLDAQGRVLAVYLATRGTRRAVIVARETETGFATVTTETSLWDAQATDLTLTGLAVALDGAVAIGIAQGGDARCAFQRSWLLQGKITGAAMPGGLRMTQKHVLYDAQGKLIDRYAVPVRLAQMEKPCVPLFTALAHGPGGTIIAGGHPADPYLRVLDNDGIRLAIPASVSGGQSVAAWPGETGEIAALAPSGDCVQIYDGTGRLMGRIGTGFPGSLAELVAMAADKTGVYAAVRHGEGYRLLHYRADGSLCWARDLFAPLSMRNAQPVLAALGADRVIIGWQEAGAAGLGWATTMMADGSPGLPLWRDVQIARTIPGDAPHGTLLAEGGDGVLYLCRITEAGRVIQSFTAAGAYKMTYPASLGGVSLVAENGEIAWARTLNERLVMVRYTAKGIERGIKHTHRPATNAELWQARTRAAAWGWLTSTQSLLRFDETMTVIGEDEIVDPDGKRVLHPIAVTGDGNDTVYLAEPGRILAVEVER